MTKLFYLLIPVAVVAALLLVKRGRAPTLARDTLQQAMERGERMLLLDVRSRKEFEGGHIPGAVHIPHDRVVSTPEAVSADKADWIIVYCERGPRALIARRALVRAGFTDVVHLAGDMSGWRASGLPTEK